MHPQTLRDAWTGGLVFGLLGPLFGGLPLVALAGILAAIDQAQRHGILGFFAGFVGGFAMGWGIAIVFGGLPALCTGVLSASWRRRVAPTTCRLFSTATAMALSLTLPLLLDLGALARSGPDSGVLAFGVMLCIPPLWAAPLCELVMSGRWFAPSRFRTLRPQPRAD